MKHNVYFNGKVQSLGANTEEGYATVGVIVPGKYTFAAEFEENVIIITGTLRVELPVFLSCLIQQVQLRGTNGIIRQEAG